MKYLKAYTLSALAILMASCSSDNDTIETSNEKTPSTTSMSFSASIDGKVTGDINGKATRTSLSNTDNPYPIWSSGDQIKVFNSATQDAQLFSISADGVGQRAATFTGEINTASSGNKFYAVYSGGVAGSNAPTISLSGTNAVVSGSIPSSQSTTAGFHPELHFMTACTEGTAFKFKNAMSLMTVTIADNNYDNFEICKIVLKSNNANENIAGDFTANIGDDGTLTNYSVTNGSSEITIGDGTTPLAVGTYYIAILPCAFSNGFTLSYLDERLDVNNDPNCKQYDRIKSTSFDVTASEIINLGTYTAKECAKEAYVDLGVGPLFCIENVYDDNENSTVNASYYSWGETEVKENQDKYSNAYRTYSWYYNYTWGSGSQDSENLRKRGYKFGVGATNWNAFTANESYSFKYKSATGLTYYTGVLLKYNSSSTYTQSSGDWTGGSVDNKTELDLEDDAAYQKSPQHILRIASEDDYQALINGVSKGTLSKGDAPNMTGFFRIMNVTTGNYILFPKGGYRFKKDKDDNDAIKNGGKTALYWTRNRSTGTDADGYDKSYMAKTFVVNDMKAISIGEVQRAHGRMIRAVIYR